MCGALLSLPTPNHDQVAGELFAAVGLRPNANGDAARPISPLAEHLWWSLGTALSQWCGPFAYHAVLTRAVTMTRTATPALKALHVIPPPAVALAGLDDIESAHGDAVLVAGMQALLAALLTILDRVIGADMAIVLVSNALTPLRAPAAPSAPPSELQP